MKILVDIPDSKVSFGMEVLKSLSFIKEAIPFSASQLHDHLKEAAEEVRLHKEGKIKLNTAQEVLNEL